MAVKIWKEELPKKDRDFLSFTAISDDKGRIVIPASVRKMLKMKFDYSILATIEEVTAKY